MVEEPEDEIPPEDLGEPDEIGQATVEININPNDPESANICFTLKSADGMYEKTLSVKDDKIPDDDIVTLTFEEIKGGTTYTLTIDAGRGDPPDEILSDIPFKKLID